MVWGNLFATMLVCMLVYLGLMWCSMWYFSQYNPYKIKVCCSITSHHIEILFKTAWYNKQHNKKEEKTSMWISHACIFYTSTLAHLWWRLWNLCWCIMQECSVNQPLHLRMTRSHALLWCKNDVKPNIAQLILRACREVVHFSCKWSTTAPPCSSAGPLTT